MSVRCLVQFARLQALFALAAACSGHACAAGTATKTPTYIDLAGTRSGFDCSPSPIGAGTFPTTRHNAAGSVAWWYCPTDDGGWRVNWAAATAAQMSLGNLFSEMQTVIASPQPRAAFRAAVARTINLPLSDPSLVAVWKPYFAEMLAGAPPRRPTRPTRIP